MATQKKGSTRQKAAAPPAAKTRRVFPVGQCHHRDAKGNPDCTEKIVAKRANLCPPHEKVWQKAARARYAANRAAAQPTTTTTTRAARKSQPTAADDAAATEAAVPATEQADDLEAQLAASVSAFATPELAAKARAKRAAQR